MTRTMILVRFKKIEAMKKLLFFVCSIWVALASCTKEQELTPPETQHGDIILTFTSKKPQLNLETKTAWNPGTSSIVWTSGDVIRVGYTIDGTWQPKGDGSDSKIRMYASDQVSIDSEDSGIGTFNVPISNTAFTDPKVSGSYVFYAVYPSASVSGTEIANAPNVNATVPSAQVNGVDTFDKSADLMVGKSTSMSLSGLPTDAISIDWSRIVAHGYLTFKDFRGVVDGETITKITLTATTAQVNSADTYLTGNVKVNLTNGAFSFNSGSNELIISGTNLAFVEETINAEAMKNLKAWVCVLPETITSLNVDVETNLAHYTREITGINKEFKQNGKNTLAINMSGATRTAKSGQLVADGYYVISYSSSNSSYMMTVGTEANSYRDAAAKNVTDPDDDAIWRINYVSASDAYTIHSIGANKGLYGATTSSSSNLTLGSGTTNLFTIEKSSSEATTFKIAPVGNSYRAIGYNTSTTPGRFALYTGGNQQPITLDLTSVTVDETPVITIADEEKTKTVSASTTSVSFTYVPNMFATVAPTVTVTSDADSIIDGDPTAADGTITVNLNANDENKAKTATLSVSGTGIATPITLTINQEAKAGDVFSYTFTNKNWNAMRGGVSENWTSGTDGAGFSNGGIQVTKTLASANGTSPYSFVNVSEIVVTYCTNGSSGAGSIDVQVGSGTEQSFLVTSSGGTTARTHSFKFSPMESGKVTITVNCTTNSVYLIGADITAASMTLPTAYSITCATGLANGTIEASKSSAYAGDEITLTAHPDDDYQLGEWTVTEATSGDAVTVTGGKFTMPADNVNVTATFVPKVDGDPTTVSMTTFTAISGNVGGDANVSYAATQGTAGTAPAVNNGEIRIYQNGGLLTITANNGKKITAITIGSSMVTTVQTKVDSGDYSSDNAIAANGTYTIDSINAETVVFKCTGTDKSHRLYLNSLSVTYK